MLSTVLMMCLMAGVFLAVAGESNWDQSTRDFIVEIHNKRRVNEGGCHINKLVYDQELERQARYWAERCVFKHENKDGRGENLAWDTKKSAETELITSAADAWFEEKNTYSYGQRSCGSPYPACHYTQMVWGSTNKVGCYSTRCANLGQAAPNAWYLVCFYTPKGNWVGEKPYEKVCATPCLEGQTEDNGLCVGEATAAKAEEEAATACENKDALCTRWAQHNQCAENAEFMKKSCRKACNLC
uniref:ShKT domain-containing protein n=1 Tax=Arion vulgaris TaxID=1028688 RepID=A0A0B7B6G9_9EUPU